MSAAFGAFSIPVLFLVMHGPVATNILNLYSATLAARSLDVKAARWNVSVAVSIVEGRRRLVAAASLAAAGGEEEHDRQRGQQE